MDYNEFLTEAVKALPEFLPAKYAGAEISIRQIDKLQGLSYTGITIGMPDSDMAMSVDLMPAFNDLQAGTPFSQVMMNTALAIHEGLERAPEFHDRDFNNYAELKDRLLVTLVPIRGNLDMLMMVPYRQVQDMAMVYRVLLDDNEKGCFSMLFTNKMCEYYGVTQSQLHEDAMKSAQEHFPYSIRSMSEVLADITGKEVSGTVTDTLYVATCGSGVNGAGCICYDGFMKNAAEKMHGSFYVLPSSVHEVLLLPETPDVDYKVLEMMVTEINRTDVLPEDRLSDKVYRYDVERQVLEKAEDYAKNLKKDPAERDTR